MTLLTSHAASPLEVLNAKSIFFIALEFKAATAT